MNLWRRGIRRILILLLMSLLIPACAKKQILIDSFPQNADVYVNGEKKGQTPLRVQVDEFFIPVGLGLYGHTITVIKEGYTQFVQELTKSRWGIDTFPNIIFAKLIKSPNALPSEKHATHEAPSELYSWLEKEIEDIPDLKVRSIKDNFAVVVGIEKYRDIRGVEFAANDAATMRRYLIKLMGYQEENVILITNERATKSDIEKYFGKWLKNRANENSQVFIYYAGHGAPNPKTGEAFIVPYDGDPNYLETTAYPLKNLYSCLSDLSAKEIIVLLDSCFSGAGGRSVIAKGTRPLVMRMDYPAEIKGNTVVFAAASGDQISISYEKARHGLFTYFFLKGLRGGADVNNNGFVDIEALYKYIRPKVEREARLQNVEQTPILYPGLETLKKRVIIKFR